jgi:enoyl-CoA hydratase/carnithine racemase
MGITQLVAPTPDAALELGVAMAKKIAAVAPLSTRATLTSARHVTTPIEADALARTSATYAALYKTEDFLEGRRAEAEGRPPKYRGR